MPLYVVKHQSLELERAYERSPFISVMTNAPSEEDIPPRVREAADRIITGDFSLLRGGAIPEGSDAAILWIASDQLFNGSSASLRQASFSPKQCGLVPLHLPCHPELDLIGLHPLIWKKGSEFEITQDRIRISRATPPAPELAEFLEERTEPWARISYALLVEQKNPGEGVQQLSKMWHDSSIILPTYGALLVRNLIVLLIQQNNFDQARSLVKLAMDCYPRCAELAYLAGWIYLQQNDLRAVCRYAQQALGSADPSFLGSGGESSYRSKWLLGLAFELDGKQVFAIQCYAAGVFAQPAFPPSVLGLLRQRVNHSFARSLFYSTLSNLIRREPEYLEPVFHFLLLHRQIDPARRILSFSPMSDDLREKLQKLIDETSAVYQPKPRLAGVAPGVMLIGPYYVHSSIARINRELGAALASSGDFEVAMEPHGTGDAFAPCLPHFESVSAGFKKRLPRLDMTIRHHWPPDFSPPPCGKLISMLHWEFGAIPKKWVSQIERNVTDFWVSSQFTKEVFARAGVRPEIIHVMPPGIETEIFKPEGPSWRPEGCRGFVFLSVGGAIARKGADVLWNAYSKAFSFTDDVTLVIKDIGASTFYKGQSMTGLIRAATSKPRSPHVIILNDEIDDARLAALYRGSNIFILPYRGEGFGMPLAEALACGKSVITTGLGPTREFCPPEATHFIPAQVSEFYNPQSGLGSMTGPYSWFEPDVDALAGIMRQVFELRNGAPGQNLLAAEKIRTHFSWQRVTRLQIDRIRELLQA